MPVSSLRSAIARWPPVAEARQFYWRTRFRLLARAGAWDREAPDGLPVPGERLRYLISGIPNYPVPDFLAMGRLCADRIKDSLHAQGMEIGQVGALLDFGCGCGRTIRNFAALDEVRLEGTDYNPELVGWCRANFGFARFGLNRLEPPTRYADASFGLVYAFSVFTHLTEPLQHAWMAELARILKPRGFLAISTLPDRILVDPALRAEFARGNFVVENAGDAGANQCMAYHPQAYMREKLATAFDVVDFVPGGVGQDFWLLRKKPEV